MKYDPEDWENYDKGIRYFNRQKFFEAHEAWEEIWKHTADEEDRKFLQGLIQLAASFVHHGRGNEGGALSLYDEAVEKLRSFRRGYWGADVEKLLASLNTVREKMEKKETITEFPTLSLIKKAGRSS